MDKVRIKFRKADSDSRLKKAVKMRMNPLVELSYAPGAEVYFKEDHKNKWSGPATVLGKDGKTIMLKHANNLRRVTSGRVMPVKAPLVKEYKPREKQSAEVLACLEQATEHVKTHDADKENEQIGNDQENSSKEASVSSEQAEDNLDESDQINIDDIEQLGNKTDTHVNRLVKFALRKEQAEKNL